MQLETRNLGIVRALGWERTAMGIDFQCVTEGLAAVRVALSAIAPRVVRGPTTPGPVAAAKRFSYVVGRPNPGSWSVDADTSRVVLTTAQIVVEASLEPWQLLFRTPDGPLLTPQFHRDANL